MKVACRLKEENILSPHVDGASARQWNPVALALAALTTFFISITMTVPALADRYRDREIWRFEQRDALVWRSGYWHNGYHRGQRGWWWVAGGSWYYYPSPVYPYPNPYVPPVVVVREAPPAPPAITGPPPTQFWYYCDRPAGYYPYVPTCPTPWREVAPQAAGQPAAPPAPAR
jgi:hypothetical protein